MSLPAQAGSARPSPAPAKRSAKAWWTKQFYLWHWVSSAICLASMLLFAFTGITLNHAGAISAKPVVTQNTAKLPPDLLVLIEPTDEAAEIKQPLPAPLRHWLDAEMGVAVGGRALEWSFDDIYVDLPRPGGDGWMSIDRYTGEVVHEVTRRGWISYLNDLHKGRHTGPEWVLFMDLFSIACIVFCLTGLALLFVHAKRRPSTWPIVIAGILLPFAILMLFVHS